MSRRDEARETGQARETDGRSSGRPSRLSEQAIDVNDVAKILSCSARHVHRLVASDRMPRPFHVGALARWRRHSIETWIADGCPNSAAVNERGGEA